MDLELSNLHRLIYHKTKPNQYDKLHYNIIYDIIYCKRNIYSIYNIYCSKHIKMMIIYREIAIRFVHEIIFSV